MGVLNWKNRPPPLPETVLNLYLPFWGEVYILPGGVGGGAVFPGLDQVTTQTGVPRVSELCMAFGVSNVG